MKPNLLQTRPPLRLECRALPAFRANTPKAWPAAFGSAATCSLGQAWNSTPEPELQETLVHVGWRDDKLLILAELTDADIVTRATAHNQRMWELGDAFEIFLQRAHDPGYVELQVTPQNHRLQLVFPDAAAVRRARQADSFTEYRLSPDVFQSQVWLSRDAPQWQIYAEIPAALVGEPAGVRAGTEWRFSFGRYDYRPGRNDPVISSSSPHAAPDFHRQAEWGTLEFVVAR